MIIAKEGYPYIAILAVPAVATLIAGWLWPGVVLLGFASFVAFFFRDPNRVFHGTEQEVASPADGRIVWIRNENGFEAISIFLSVFNVHINRAPVSGKISEIEYHKGKFLIAYDERASVENERNSITMDHQGQIVRFVQIAGLIARRIVCWRKAGESLATGDKIGLIKFGSRVDVFLPNGSKIYVKRGDRVFGGKTALGELPHTEKSS
jgi:phosphatidylserine decarboxylase